MRDPESGKNVFANKLLGIHISDICQRFSFNLFSKIISADQQITFVPDCFGERANYIYAPLSEWPGAGQGVKNSSRLVHVWCKFLTLITLLHIFLCFFLHIWPPVALSDDSVRQRLASYVASTNSFMYLLKEQLCHFRVHTEQKWLRKKRLYNFWSLDSQKRGTFLLILSASNLSSGKMSFLRYSTIRSIQLGLTLIW